MKKTLIAGAGVAALGMAALPFAGVFAADGTMSQTDTVVVTVDSACSLASSGSSVTPTAYTYPVTIANGAYNDSIVGSTFTIICNDTAGWSLYAIGDGTESGHVDYMDGTNTTNVIQSADGSHSEGASTSSWGFKITTEDPNITITDGYTGLKAVPTTQTKIATSSSTTDTSGRSVTAGYGIGISQTQAADVYTGKVKYTLVHPASATPAAQQQSGGNG